MDTASRVSAPAHPEARVSAVLRPAALGTCPLQGPIRGLGRLRLSPVAPSDFDAGVSSFSASGAWPHLAGAAGRCHGAEGPAAHPHQVFLACPMPQCPVSVGVA